MQRLSVVLMAGVAALTASCGGNPQPVVPAQWTIFADLSASSPLSSDPRAAGKIAAHLHGEILNGGLALGDRIRLLSIGERSTSNAIARTIRLDRRNRHAAAARQVASLFASIPRDPARGQGETSILFSLENAAIICTPRSKVIVVSDDIESSADFSDAQGLLDGTAQLPAPSRPYLRGCGVELLALGLTADGTPQLDNAQVRNLRAAWQRYLAAAGVRPADITIVTSL